MKRSSLRRHRTALLALLCTVTAIVVALLAADVSAWRSIIARDDIRFRALPAHRQLWHSAAILPGDPARRLLGIDSAISYRHALQYFWFSRVGSNPDVRQDTPTLRANAQNQLLSIVTSALSARQRSTAANLLGVLVVTTPSIGGSGGGTTAVLTRAAEYFQEAIALDAGNADAKENLELVLRIKRPGKSGLGHDARRGYGFGRGHGITSQGGGY